MLFLQKDLTTLEPPVMIAHGVNCQNVMGSGVARALYMQWPVIKARYHKKGSMVLGDTQFVEVEPGLVIANCFTQREFGRDMRRYANPRAIRECLEDVASYALDIGIREVHMPRIGCGLGGLDWEEDVYPELMEIEKVFPMFFVVCDL